MSLRDDMRASAALYRGFREEEPRRVRAVRLKIPRAAAVMGKIEFIGYMTTHGRKTHLYVHQFATGSRPTFVAGAGRNQAFFIGGRYRVTDRGIVDFDAAGREVRGRDRYRIEVIKR